VGRVRQVGRLGLNKTLVTNKGSYTTRAGVFPRPSLVGGAEAPPYFPTRLTRPTASEASRP